MSTSLLTQGVTPPKILAVLITAIISGCAPREQAFDCIQAGNPTGNDELVMSPTSARFQSIRYEFRSEQAALRIYGQKETGQILEFNPASGLLRVSAQDWSCKKYSLDIEKKLRN